MPATPSPTDAIGRALRHDGWTPDRQQHFLRLIAQGHTATDACRQVGLSTSSAYALRDRAAGAGFALGWAAANLRAREPIADALLARAIHGQVEWRARPDGERVERFRFDNGLASRMLARLDGQAAAEGPAGYGAGHGAGHGAGQGAARIVAGEFEAYLDALGRDDGPARAGLFVAERTKARTAADLAPVQALARADRFDRAGAGLASEVDTADLDPAARASWTDEQWVRAEAAGLVTLAPDTSIEGQEGQLVADDEAADGCIWHDDLAGEWRTDFPPPPGFRGWANGEWGDDGYERELADDEYDLMRAADERARRLDRAEELAERDRWCAAMLKQLAAGEALAPPIEPMPPVEPTPPVADDADPAGDAVVLDPVAPTIGLNDDDLEEGLARWDMTPDGLRPANAAALTMAASVMGWESGPSIRAV